MKQHQHPEDPIEHEVEATDDLDERSRTASKVIPCFFSDKYPYEVFNLQWSQKVCYMKSTNRTFWLKL